MGVGGVVNGNRVEMMVVAERDWTRTKKRMTIRDYPGFNRENTFHCHVRMLFPGKYNKNKNIIILIYNWLFESFVVTHL